MPVIMRETPVPAGGVVENALAGSAFEFARQNSLISLGVNAAETGTFVTIQSGPDIVAEEFSPALSPATGNPYPVIPDQMYFSDVATAGDRLVVRLRNPTASEIIVYTVCQVAPL